MRSLRFCICPSNITSLVLPPTLSGSLPKPSLLTTIVCCNLVINKLPSVSQSLICLLSAALSEDVRVRERWSEKLLHISQREKEEKREKERGPRSTRCCIFCSSHGLPALEEMMNRGFTSSPAALASSHHRIQPSLP